MSLSPSNDAAALIQRDLATLRTQRLRALAIYFLLLAAVVVVLARAPHPHNLLPRDSLWIGGLVLFLVGAALGAWVTIGVPLLRGPTFFAVGVAGLASTFAGVFLLIDWSKGAETDVRLGLKCFTYGTALSSIAMAALGVVSARLWRRFPDPAIFAAAGTASVGLVALHITCGAHDLIHLLGFHLTPVIIAFGLARALTRLRSKLDEQDL